MKAKELAELLLENPEFEVKFTFTDYAESRYESEYGLDIRNFYINRIADIGYSDKIIQLGGNEL